MVATVHKICELLERVGNNLIYLFREKAYHLKTHVIGFVVGDIEIFQLYMPTDA